MGITFYQRFIEHRVICDRVLKAFQCIRGSAEIKSPFSRKMAQSNIIPVAYAIITKLFNTIPHIIYRQPRNNTVKFRPLLNQAKIHLNLKAKIKTHPRLIRKLKVHPNRELQL